MTLEGTKQPEDIAKNLTREQRHFLVFNSAMNTLKGANSDTVAIAESLVALDLITISSNREVSITKEGATIISILRGVPRAQSVQAQIPQEVTRETQVVQDALTGIIPRTDEALSPPRKATEIARELTPEYVEFLDSKQGFVLDRSNRRMTIISEYFQRKGCITINERGQIILTDFGNMVLIEALKLRRARG